MTKSVYDEIREERAYQDGKWGVSVDDTKNTPWMFAAYIGQYATKWMVGSFLPIAFDTTTAFRKCMVKVAAIAVAAIESVDRQRAANGATFYEEREKEDA